MSSLGDSVSYRFKFSVENLKNFNERITINDIIIRIVNSNGVIIDPLQMRVTAYADKSCSGEPGNSPVPFYLYPFLPYPTLLYADRINQLGTVIEVLPYGTACFIV